LNREYNGAVRAYNAAVDVKSGLNDQYKTELDMFKTKIETADKVTSQLMQFAQLENTFENQDQAAAAAKEKFDYEKTQDAISNKQKQEQLDQGAWSIETNSKTGAMYRINKKTGEIKNLVGGSSGTGSSGSGNSVAYFGGGTNGTPTSSVVINDLARNLSDKNSYEYNLETLQNAAQDPVKLKNAVMTLVKEKLGTTGAQKYSILSEIADGSGQLASTLQEIKDSGVNTGKIADWSEYVKEKLGQGDPLFVKFNNQRANLSDLLSRARSGAALTKEEVATYRGMIPSITDNQESQATKLSQFQNLVKNGQLSMVKDFVGEQYANEIISKPKSFNPGSDSSQNTPQVASEDDVFGSATPEPKIGNAGNSANTNSTGGMKFKDATQAQKNAEALKKFQEVGADKIDTIVNKIRDNKGGYIDDSSFNELSKQFGGEQSIVRNIPSGGILYKQDGTKYHRISQNGVDGYVKTSKPTWLTNYKNITMVDGKKMAVGFIPLN
jgi:hypothetical protein